jgi:hypothetical protein
MLFIGWQLKLSSTNNSIVGELLLPANYLFVLDGS